MIDVFLSALPGEHATKQLMNIGSTQHLLTPLGLLTPFILTSFVRTKCTINVKQGVSDHPSGMYIDKTKHNCRSQSQRNNNTKFYLRQLGEGEGHLGNSVMTKYLKGLSLYLQNCDEQNYAITVFTGCSKM